MRCLNSFSRAAVAALLVTGALARGQTLLNTLEAQLQSGAAGGAAPADAAPLPGSGYLGMFPDENDTGGKGVRVHSVKQDGPAEKSGLKSGDLITVIDGKAITKLTDLDDVLGKALAGQKLRISIERDGKAQTLNVTLGTRPPPAAGGPTLGEAPTLVPPTTSALTDPTPRPPTTTPADAPPPPLPGVGTAPGALEPAPGGIRARPLDFGQPPAEPAPAEATAAAPADGLPSPTAGSGGATLGITVVPLTDEARTAYRVSAARRGALITSIRPGSPADRSGLPIGGVVVRVDERMIDSADELVALIRAARPGQEVELSYYEGDRFSRKKVRLGPAGTVGAPAATPREGPLGYGTGPGTGNDRPLLSKVERTLDSLAGGARGLSTVYNPADMAALQARMQELAEQMQKLDDRLKSIESKLGTAAGTATLAPATPTAPAPGFGGLAPAGTNP